MEPDNLLLLAILLTQGGGIGAVLSAHRQALRRLDWACRSIRSLSDSLGHRLEEEPPR